MARKIKNTKLVAEICMYGNGAMDVGYGWLARLEDGTLLGDGEPHPGRNLTSCLWTACDEIRGMLAANCKPTTGMVRVFVPGGRMMADADLNHQGYFGELKFVTATVIEISAEAILAAAK